MKHILRKPLLPCVLLVLLVFSVCFMTLFQQSIEDNQTAVEDMYDNVQLTFQVLPGTSANGELKLRNKTVTKLQKVEGVTDCFYYLECPYSLRSPIQLANYSSVYGTNNLSFFAEERGVTITLGDGWDEDAIIHPEEGGSIPCVLEINLAGVLGVNTGDTFVIAPNADEETDPEAAPSMEMVVAGTFEDEAGLVDLYSIIVADLSFLGSPGFLYSSTMMESFYYYRTFQFLTDPIYNRDFQMLKDEINAVLKKAGDYILYSNVRILEQAVRPLDQKIRIQQMLVTPLSILLCVATAVMAVFLCAGFSGEVFLRLLWGEKRILVWLKMIGGVIFLMAIEGLIALGLVWFVCGANWIDWAAKYMALIVGTCFAAISIQQTIFCTKNMVVFYQSKEG